LIEASGPLPRQANRAKNVFSFSREDETCLVPPITIRFPLLILKLSASLCICQVLIPHSSRPHKSPKTRYIAPSRRLTASCASRFFVLVNTWRLSRPFRPPYSRFVSTPPSSRRRRFYCLFTFHTTLPFRRIDFQLLRSWPSPFAHTFLSILTLLSPPSHIIFLGVSPSMPDPEQGLNCSSIRLSRPSPLTAVHFPRLFFFFTVSFLYLEEEFFYLFPVF